MPGTSKVIVLDPDVRAGRQILLGFQREGVAAEMAEVPHDPAALALPAAGAGLVVVGGTDTRGIELVRHARRCLGEAALDAPIVFAGRGVRRTDVEAAGADEVLLPPTFLRDVVTIGRLLRGQPQARRDHLIGSLAETTGVLTLVRALAALGRSAVLTLVRGLRRGEVRFYHGEVTSAQVGMIHGQAALHQLLLWTDARFEFRHEDIVRRHQIPLDRDELFADAERFLGVVREESGGLSPSMVLERDAARLKELDGEIPGEVHGVLRMFDGHRVLADVLEDSPYRVFETLRVAQLAVAAGLLRAAAKPRPRATWRAVLAIEEWLVGTETREEVVERQASGDSAPVPSAAADPPSGAAPRAEAKPGSGSGSGKSGPNRSKGSRKKRKKKGRANTPPAASPVVAATPAPAPAPAAPPKKPEIDWGALVPRTVGVEVGPVTAVVPASHASGEIMLPREKLEELTDAAGRDRIFSAEPTVMFDEAATRESAPRLKVEDAPKAEAAPKAEDAPAPDQAPAAEAVLPPADPTERMPALHDEAPQEALAPEQAPAAEAGPQATPALEQAPAAEVAPQATPATEQAPAAEAAPQATPATEPAPAAEAKSPAEPADPVQTAPTERMPALQVEALQAEAPRAEAPPTDALQAEVLQTLPTERMPALEADALQAPPTERMPALQAEASQETPTERMPASEIATLAKASASEAAPVTLADATPTRRIRTPSSAMEPIKIERPPSSAEPSSAAAEPPAEESPRAERASDQMPAITIEGFTGAPDEELIDEPSDGVVRQTLFTAETAPAARRPPVDIPEDDRPEDAIGEIVTKTGQLDAAEPPQITEPTILVEDLAEVHTAVSAVAAAQAAAPPTPTMATPVTERTVSEVSDDAAEAFSDVEEDFFRAGHDKPAKPAAPAPGESFDDLDEGYRPLGFWDRLLGRKPKR